MKLYSENSLIHAVGLADVIGQVFPSAEVSPEHAVEIARLFARSDLLRSGCQSALVFLRFLPAAAMHGPGFRLIAQLEEATEGLVKL